jgi:hypothetical protein
MLYPWLNDRLESSVAENVLPLVEICTGTLAPSRPYRVNGWAAMKGESTRMSTKKWEGIIEKKEGKGRGILHRGCALISLWQYVKSRDVKETVNSCRRIQ